VDSVNIVILEIPALLHISSIATKGSREEGFPDLFIKLSKSKNYGGLLLPVLWGQDASASVHE
jgi:hypothetical protein